MRRRLRRQGLKQVLAGAAIAAFSSCLPHADELPSHTQGIPVAVPQIRNEPAQKAAAENVEIAPTKEEPDMPEPLKRFFAEPRKPVVFTPEYSRKHFFMVVPGSRFREKGGYKKRIRVGENAFAVLRLPTEGEIIKEQARIAAAILATSRETSVTVFVNTPDENERTSRLFRQAAPALGMAAFAKRFRIRYAEGIAVYGGWAQDYGEGIFIKEGSSEFVVGMATHGMRLPKNAPPLNMPVWELPIVFEGGNMTPTTLNGRRFIIAGMDILEETRHAHPGRYEISQNEISDILKKTFAADAVLFLMRPLRQSRRNRRHIGHIDQAVFFPKDGIAVMPKLEAEPPTILKEWREETEQYHAQLKKAGFAIIDIPTTPETILWYQTYANSIPIQTTDGKTTIIMPSFGDKDTERQIRQILNKNGMGVVFIRDVAYAGFGGPHCLVGSLAETE